MIESPDRIVRSVHCGDCGWDLPEEPTIQGALDHVVAHPAHLVSVELYVTSRVLMGEIVHVEKLTPATPEAEL